MGIFILRDDCAPRVRGASLPKGWKRTDPRVSRILGACGVQMKRDLECVRVRARGQLAQEATIQPGGPLHPGARAPEPSHCPRLPSPH